MSHLQFDIPGIYPLPLKRDLARKMGELYSHIMQTTPDL